MDARALRLRIVVGEQPRDRHIDEARISHVAFAIGEG
jgi:hypothetical protein